MVIKIKMFLDRDEGITSYIWMSELLLFSQWQILRIFTIAHSGFKLSKKPELGN